MYIYRYTRIQTLNVLADQLQDMFHLRFRLKCCSGGLYRREATMTIVSCSEKQKASASVKSFKWNNWLNQSKSCIKWSSVSSCVIWSHSVFSSGVFGVQNDDELFNVFSGCFHVVSASPSCPRHRFEEVHLGSVVLLSEDPPTVSIF